MDRIAPTSFDTNRVRTLLLSVLFLFCAQAPVCFAQPNVILIICDDLNDSVEGMGGHVDAKTPQIQEIMQAGVRFTNAHCNAPICGPSRASLWTGLLPSTSGYYGFDQQSNDWRDFDLLSDAVTLMEHFKANNYTVWGSGKIFHNGHDDNSVFSVTPASDGAGPSDFGPFPWDGVVPGSGNYASGQHQHPDMPTSNWGYYPSTTSLDNNPGDTPGYVAYDWALKSGPFNYTSEGGALGIDGDVRDLMPDEISAQWAEDKLAQNNNDPFLMVVGMNRPHAPFYAPKEFFDLFKDVNGNNTVSLPPLPSGDDLADLPDIAKGRPFGDLLDRGYQSGMNKYKQDYGNGANEWWLNFIQGYLACVAFADHQVGVIWDALQASLYANNTIVIVTSDHGYHLGEKDHSSKTTPWEETTRVPLVIYTPEMRPGGSLASVAGQECSTPVSLIDLYPTLNALCGMPADPNGGAGKNNTVLDGNDLTPLLEAPIDGQWNGPSVALSHLHNARVDWPADTKSPWALNHHAVRSENYRYIRYSDGAEELYDHSVDPNEWSNEAGNGVYTAEKAIMKQRLFASLGLANTENLISNGSFESGLSNWLAGGSAGATLNTSDSLVGNNSVLVTSGTTVISEVIVDYPFNDADGTILNNNALTNDGVDSGSWNYGHFKVQAGALNVGYTQEFKSPDVDSNPGGSTNTSYRLCSLNSAITSGEFEFVVDISQWDLRRNWDGASSAAGKGIQFSLMMGSSSVNVRFETFGSNGFRASASGLASGSVYGNSFDNSLWRVESNGGLLRITGNLDSGAWTASAKDGLGGAYQTITSGSGLTSIDGIRFNTLSPSDGSWGGAGVGNATDPAADGTSGDFMRIDRITLSNTITTSDGGLEQNMLAVLEPGKSYHVSAWARSSTSGAVQLDMRETTGSGQATDVAIGSVAANDTEFLLIEGDYTVPDNLTGLSLIAQGADFSLDHVQVYEYQTPNIVASVVIDDGDGSISLGWNAELGVSYRLEQSLNLANGWTVLESDLTADKSKMIWEFTPNPTFSRAFWRVIKNP